jgi:hypothetical protein
MNEKGKTPLQQRQERIQRLKEIYKANEDKPTPQVEKLLRETLENEGLTPKKIREYLEIVMNHEL